LYSYKLDLKATQKELQGMPKIIILIYNLDGGAGKVNVLIANYLALKGYHVTLICATAGKHLVKIVDTKVNFIVSENKSLLSYGISAAKNIGIIKPDTIMANGVTLFSVIYIYCIPIKKPYKWILRIPTAIGASLGYESKLKAIKKILCAQIALSKANIVIANSKGTKDDSSKINIKSKEKTVVIYNPINRLDFKDESKDNKKKHITKLEKVNILNVGRLVHQKDQASLIKAFMYVRKKYCNAKLTIVGDGPLETELKKLSNNLKLSRCISFLGYTSDISQYYISCDVFVLSSKFEGFGLVLTEALSYSCNIVSTECPSGPNEILKDGKYGRLVPVGEPKLLGKAIIQAIENPILYNRDEALSRFMLKIIGKEYENILAQ
jgi:glycosyltransferase involved in cell wall biosynthesis